MPATNSTTHYELPIFIGTDKPSWMGDWNGAMNKIDAALAEIAANTTSAVTTANAASTTAQAAQTAVTTLSGRVNDVETAQTGMSQNIQQNTQAIQALSQQVQNIYPVNAFTASFKTLNNTGTLTSGGSGYYYLQNNFIVAGSWLMSANTKPKAISAGGTYQIGVSKGNTFKLPSQSPVIGSTLSFAQVGILFYNVNENLKFTTLFAAYDGGNNCTYYVIANVGTLSSLGTAVAQFMRVPDSSLGPTLSALPYTY